MHRRAGVLDRAQQQRLPAAYVRILILMVPPFVSQHAATLHARWRVLQRMPDRHRVATAGKLSACAMCLHTYTVRAGPDKHTFISSESFKEAYQAGHGDCIKHCCTDTPMPPTCTALKTFGKGIGKRYAYEGKNMGPWIAGVFGGACAAQCVLDVKCGYWMAHETKGVCQASNLFTCCTWCGGDVGSRPSLPEICMHPQSMYSHPVQSKSEKGTEKKAMKGSLLL